MTKIFHFNGQRGNRSYGRFEAISLFVSVDYPEGMSDIAFASKASQKLSEWARELKLDYSQAKEYKE